MLSGLRPGSPIYVVHKDGPRVTTAKVVQLSSQYPPQFNFQMPQAGATLSPMFDLTVDIDGKTELFQRIPINTSVAEFPDKGVIVSETRDGVVNEINNILGWASTELEKRSFYEQTVSNCKNILVDINPELKRDQEQADKIAKLEQGLAAVNGQVQSLVDLMSKSVGKKSKED